MATPADILGDAQTWVTEQVPYVWGGVTRFGADCSGFVKSVFGEVGVSLAGRTSQQQATEGAPVAGGLAAAKPGDLIFYNYEGPNSHVAIYAGNGQQYAETSTGHPATLQPVDTGSIGQIRRYIDQMGNPVGPGVTLSAPTPAPGPAGAPRYTPGSSPTATLTSSGAGYFNPFDPTTWGSAPASAAAAGAGDVLQPLISWVDSYAIRAALFVFGVLAVIVGLVRLFTTEDERQTVEKTAGAAAAA
jgi:NlpC/P60 family